jgi:hypothetical protein
VTNLTKARLITVLLIASLFAYSLAWFHLPGLHGIPGLSGTDGMSDGGGLL